MLTKVRSNNQVKNGKRELSSLWMSLMEGDRDALSELFSISYSWLFNYGYKIVPNEDFVKDAIQELFLMLWKKRTSVNEAQSVKAYLFSSLRRIIFRKLEKKEHRIARNHYYQENMFEEVYNIEEVIIHFETDWEEREQLALALQSLSKRHKEAIYLKFYDGLSNAEIAEVMQINIQSVYNHISETIYEMQEFVNNCH
jgi:RNA polymerase sigma factor (sigma-70 family)